MAGHFHQGFHFLGALERTPDIVVTGAGVERQQLEAMRTLHLRASRTRWPRSGNIIEHFRHLILNFFVTFGTGVCRIAASELLGTLVRINGH